MSLKKIVAFMFVIAHLYGEAQSNEEKKAFLFSSFSEYPETMYFPFNEDSLQLIIIPHYDHWLQKGMLYDRAHPRSGSWFDHQTAPVNYYLWRNRKGKIVKAYNIAVDSSQIDGIQIGLNSTDYTNRTNFSSLGLEISDCREFDRYFKFYGENNKVGLVDLKGNIVVPADFGDVRRFWNQSGGKTNILLVEKDGKIGLLDSNLKELFPPVFTEYPQQCGQYLKIVRDKKCGLIDENGKIHIDFMFDDIQSDHDSLYIGLIYKDNNELKNIRVRDYWHLGNKVKGCRVYDQNFNVIAALNDYEYIQFRGMKQLIVKKNNQFGILNYKGEVVIPLAYDTLVSSNSYWVVYKECKCGLMDLKGKLVLPVEFESVEFYGQAIYVTQNELIGIYNDQFRLIAKPQFKEKKWEMGKYILIRPDGSRGFIAHLNVKCPYYESPEGKRTDL
jgi:hypothetical protein